MKSQTELPLIHRDLSWLSFNERILTEAQNRELPIYDRLKFLAIYSSNLDEFFRVRVAALQNLQRVRKEENISLENNPKKILKKILKEVVRQQELFGATFRKLLLPELEKAGVTLLDKVAEQPEQLAFLREYFSQEILPYIHPEILLKGKVAHFLRDRSIYLALQLKQKGAEEDAEGSIRYWYAAVLIPTHYFPRFIEVPCGEGKHCYAFLDDVVRLGLDLVFPGFDVVSAHSMKMSRNADLQMEEELPDKLPKQIHKALSNRKVGAPARFLYDKVMPETMLSYLKNSYKLNKQEMVPGGRYHNFMDFFALPNPVGDSLAAEHWPPLPYEPLEQAVNIFDAINERDHLLHFPYHSYDSVIRFLNEAAVDPQVTHIQTTQYRVANHSAIVDALIRASRNGKNVTVFVEIKARFDEASNLRTAQAMAEAGVNIMYSHPNLKVHAKIALVSRMEGDQRTRSAFLSTGNFNEKTAQLYGDHGLFTANPQITAELKDVFVFLKDLSKKEVLGFQHLLVAQFNMKQEFLNKLDREIEAAKKGERAYCCLKMNNLEEEEVIAKLYEASQAGVEIDLIIRGICCLKPQLKGYSENIRAMRIVDRYLEHARVFLFHNGGDEEIWMGSADWMDRNLNRRVEVAFPIWDEILKKQIKKVLEIQLSDNVKAGLLDQDLRNIPVPVKKKTARIQSQAELYRWVKEGCQL